MYNTPGAKKIPQFPPPPPPPKKKSISNPQPFNNQVLARGERWVLAGGDLQGSHAPPGQPPAARQTTYLIRQTLFTSVLCNRVVVVTFSRNRAAVHWLCCPQDGSHFWYLYVVEATYRACTSGIVLARASCRWRSRGAMTTSLCEWVLEMT